MRRPSSTSVGSRSRSSSSLAEGAVEVAHHYRVDRAVQGLDAREGFGRERGGIQASAGPARRDLDGRVVGSHQRVVAAPIDTAQRPQHRAGRRGRRRLRVEVIAAAVHRGDRQRCATAGFDGPAGVGPRRRRIEIRGVDRHDLLDHHCAVVGLPMPAVDGGRMPTDQERRRHLTRRHGRFGLSGPQGRVQFSSPCSWRGGDGALAKSG